MDFLSPGISLDMTRQPLGTLAGVSRGASCPQKIGRLAGLHEDPHVATPYYLCECVWVCVKNRMAAGS